MFRPLLPALGLSFTLLGTTAFADTELNKAWIEAMTACEDLISNQSFDGFDGYADVPSLLNIEPQLERAFQHPSIDLIASAINDGSEWFLCVIRGDISSDRGGIIWTITGTLARQINENNDYTMVFDWALAPVRVICRGAGQLTTVLAFYDDDRAFKVVAVGRLPPSVQSPCPE